MAESNHGHGAATITTVASAGIDPLLHNARDTATLLGIGTRLLWTLTHRGDIRCVRIGRTVRYSRDDVLAFIAKHRSNKR